MKIAIHPRAGSYSDHWINWCEKNKINWKSVDCFNTEIIQNISDCDALMWHYSQNNPKAILFAKQLLLSVEASGRKVFPNSNTVWHFDDKVGQKYLLEAINAPLVATWIFYEKKEALFWAEETEFPKIFKLRSGAGSQNVRLINTRKDAYKIIDKAFGLGFPSYDPIGSLKERWRLFYLNKTPFIDLLEGVFRFIVPPPYVRIRGNEKGYVYFQEFIPENDHDIRIVIIENKAFAIKRMVRENDFRASGSGSVLYDRHLFNEDIIKLSFDIAHKLGSQCLAMDYVYHKNNPFLLEISYGSVPKSYNNCPGYWDKELKWHEGQFNPWEWIVENLVTTIGLEKDIESSKTLG
ncbi:MAG: hypothetical protein JW870_19060 [Candidatus Delongbacteria bacterium]|nr:hypothetical protein [Candidatus Delongbacteria bacterium]